MADLWNMFQSTRVFLNLIKREAPKQVAWTAARLWKMLVWTSCTVVLVGTVGVRSRELNIPSGVTPANTLALEILAAHNAVRVKTQLPPLQWSSELAAFSQKWANKLLAKNRYTHNPNSPYGENIFIGGVGCIPSAVVMEWASESKYYSYGTNACNGDCGHYTQIVWRNTRRVGCAVARNSVREVWVCSYDPPGNYRGEWPY
jgi:uncharacterized protein YkwD